MDGLIGFIIGGMIGACAVIVMYAEYIKIEGMEQFNKGYNQGLEDGKRRKEEK